MYSISKPTKITRTRAGSCSPSSFISPSNYPSIFTILLVFFVIILGPTNNIRPVVGRKHHLVLQHDFRRLFPISTFGYFNGGSLNITVTKFKFHTGTSLESASNQFGLTLAETISSNYSPYLEGQRSCLLNNNVNKFQSIGMILFKFDFKNNRVLLSCNSKLRSLTILGSSQSSSNQRAKRAPPLLLDNFPANKEKSVDSNKNEAQSDSQPQLPQPPKDSPAKQEPPEVKNSNNQPEVAVKPPSESADKVQEVKEPQNVAEAPKQQQSELPQKPRQQEQQQQQPPVPEKSQDDTDDQDVPDPGEQIAGEPVAVDNIPVAESKKDSNSGLNVAEEQSESKCETSSIEMKRSGPDDDPEYSFHFRMYVTEPSLKGLYALYFHNCLNYPPKLIQMGAFTDIDLDMYIEEKNLNNYLSAGEIPLPQLYFALSVIFFILGTVWFYSLQNRANETFKIHYLMGVLVFVKAISLLFHGINYYFIAKEGTQVETWAVLYYVTHFLKGALLFITIVLIGTGWAFIKHILSDKDKKIFMIVIPLQVIANIADIITEESEEGALIHTVWREIFILVDMICCGAILFPVIWSIRHLQEASQTDGKAAINLKKLQLFRHFYVMIVIYIYFTRIIVYLVKITVPFNYEWLDQLFQHVATLIFFVLTGYRFQPASSNPYYQLLQEEVEMDEEVLFIQPSTFTEAKKRNRDLESSDVQSLIGRGGAANTFDYD